MVDLNAHPTYPALRTLQYVESAPLQGHDVYALQTALLEAGFDPHGLDGVFGRGTSAAVKAAQQSYRIQADSKAGGQTQRELVLEIARAVRDEVGIAVGALNGQLEHESGFRVGNYTSVYADGSWDQGVAQLNSHRQPGTKAFDVRFAIRELANDIRKHFLMFKGVNELRRWQLAQGAWNRPAYACWLANREGATISKANLPRVAPTQLQLQTLEAYIASVSAYLHV